MTSRGPYQLQPFCDPVNVSLVPKRRLSFMGGGTTMITSCSLWILRLLQSQLQATGEQQWLAALCGTRSDNPPGRAGSLTAQCSSHHEQAGQRGDRQSAQSPGHQAPSGWQGQSEVQSKSQTRDQEQQGSGLSWRLLPLITAQGEGKGPDGPGLSLSGQDVAGTPGETGQHH